MDAPPFGRYRPYEPVTVRLRTGQAHAKPGAHTYDWLVSAVMIVEDDETLASVVASYLVRDGHTAQHVGTGEHALRALESDPPDLVLLDIMLPELDGLEVCRRLRATHPDLPVIMLTALGEVDDRIAGLERGADDYLVKPFSPRELMLRIQSVLRRTAPVSRSERLVHGAGIEVDTSARRAWRAGAELNLTVREFDLLAFLMSHPGVAFRREELMREVWGWTFGDQSTVTVHVRRLREKIELDPTDPQIIQTVWGVGYRLEQR
jgi:DNA-binding response OmpR family regulator